MTAVSQKRYTLPAYLKFEYDAEWRHYFNDGIVGAMPYASHNKSKITLNFLVQFGNASEDTDYGVYINSRMLSIPKLNVVFYPNVMITNGKEKFQQFNKNMNANVNPCAILEVEEAFDFDKWQCYREIPSLQQYFMISQTEPYIDIYNRMGNSDKWENTYVNRLEQTIRIAEFDISVEKIYKKVVFPEMPELSADALYFEK